MVGCIEPFEVVVSCLHVAMVVALVCPHFPSFPEIYAAYLPLDVLIFKFLRHVVYTTVQIRAQYFFLAENGGST